MFAPHAPQGTSLPKATSYPQGTSFARKGKHHSKSPFCHTTKETFLLVGAGGFGPPKSVTTDLQSAPFDRSGTLPYSLDRLARRLEPVDGLEPPTC